MALALLLCSAVLALVACSSPRTQIKVLVIGNSFTDFNGGIDTQLNRMDRSIRASRIAPGGYSLQQHWTQGQALASVRSGGWDYVVLQEQSQMPVIARDSFRRYVTAFVQEIRKSGAEPVLLMTWERPDTAAQGVTTGGLAAAYKSIGGQLGVKVAPVGLAFAEARRQRPDISLYRADGHPTVAGTYLAACVLYETITGSNPVGLGDSDKSISRDDRIFLQGVAAATAGL